MALELEKRTSNFAKRVRAFCRNIRQPISNEDIRQLIRSSGSIGANYIESLESLGEKDELMKLKIVRKEARESAYWLDLIIIDSQELESEKNNLIDEANQLSRIFSSIIMKVMNRPSGYV